MAKLNLDQLDRYTRDDEMRTTEKFKRKKPSNVAKQHVKKENKHKKQIEFEDSID